MKKFIQFDEAGNIGAVVVSAEEPVCALQIEVPLEAVVDGMRVNLETLELEPLPEEEI